QEASASLAATRTILSCSVVPVNSFFIFTRVCLGSGRSGRSCGDRY
ncbi:hypothetical protein HMPREF9374_1969, partial [Desmospora sp. 8437]